jgi:hypothetical protein
LMFAEGPLECGWARIHRAPLPEFPGVPVPQ